jgi:putative transposase
MTQKQKTSITASPATSVIPAELLDQLSAQVKTEHDLSSLMGQLMKQLVERSLKAELTEHLSIEQASNEPANATPNSRNGYMSKTLKGSFGELTVQTPRDCKSTFEPILVRKSQTRFPAFDDQIIALYARGMTTRDIADMFLQLYGAEVSHSLISKVTEAVLDEVNIWRNRPLDAAYPIVYLDCIVVKVQDNKRVINKAVYVALGVNMDGKKELLGLWMSDF